jgi:hypothetical protein
MPSPPGPGFGPACCPIVLWYRQGVPLHEIGRRLSPLGGAWDADHALDVATMLIARALNRPELSDIQYL